MKSTHWSHSDNPEDWTDEPAATPEEAARQLIEHEDYDLACDIRDDLLRGGSPIEITVHGYYETDALIPDGDDCFDGYEPGCSYFMPTGEEVTIMAEVTYRKKPTVGIVSPNPTDQRADSAPPESRC